MYTALENYTNKEIFLFGKIRNRENFLLVHCRRSVKQEKWSKKIDRDLQKWPFNEKNGLTVTRNP